MKLKIGQFESPIMLKELIDNKYNWKIQMMLLKCINFVKIYWISNYDKK